MRVLVTRPEEDHAALGAALDAMGHEIVSAPLLSIRFFPEAVIPDQRWQALLVTSANGARALAAHPAFERLRHVPVCAVGPASAGEAQRLGFMHVTRAGGDGAALATLVVETLDPEAGPLLHVAGSVTAGDLKGVLEARGFRVTRAVIYEAAVATQLPEVAMAGFDAASIDAALFHSPRTAATFARLVREAGRAQSMSAITAYCLSEAVADALTGLPFKAVRIAAAPQQEALLALL